MKKVHRPPMATEERQQVVEKIHRGRVDRVERREVCLGYGEAFESDAKFPIDLCDLRLCTGLLPDETRAGDLAEMASRQSESRRETVFDLAEGRLIDLARRLDVVLERSDDEEGHASARFADKLEKADVLVEGAGIGLRAQKLRELVDDEEGAFRRAVFSELRFEGVEERASLAPDAERKVELAHKIVEQIGPAEVEQALGGYSAAALEALERLPMARLESGPDFSYRRRVRGEARSETERPFERFFERRDADVLEYFRARMRDERDRADNARSGVG